MGPARRWRTALLHGPVEELTTVPIDLIRPLSALIPMRALLLINNSISADLAELALDSDEIRPEEAALITLRKLHRPWFDRCTPRLDYPAAPRLDLKGQWRFTAYYWRGARLLSRVLRHPGLREIYLVNNDNLLTNHLLASASRLPRVRITVLAEGLMNYQDIQAKNRAAWRNRLKPLLAGCFGLRNQPVTGHLSGAFDPAVSRVISFEAKGLHAPPEKVTILPFKAVAPRVSPRGDTLLYIETALWQWMPAEEWEPIARGFARWIHTQGFARLRVKAHPNYPPCPLLRSLLPPFELVHEGKSLEQVASEIEASAVVGTCCTGLVTLRLLRPDLRCVDYGSNRYIHAAYHGDRSVIRLMESLGVELIDFNDGEAAGKEGLAV